MRRHSVQSTLSLILMMIPLLACNYLYAVPDDRQPDAPTTATPSYFYVSNIDFEAVVFSAELAESRRYGDFTVFPTSASYWTPSEDDIQTLEANIETFLAENLDAFYDRQAPVEEWLVNYARQYYGYERDGEQYIYGNFLCDFDLIYEHPVEDLIMVEDGGDCFFQLHYNVNTQGFFDLTVNGFA